MIDLISDPKLYLLFIAAYVVGFVDTDDPSGAKAWWEHLSGASFWGGVVLAVYLCVTHGAGAGSIGLLATWAVGVAGVRRGIIAQRNLLWESLLWTMPFDQLIARPAVKAVVAEPRPVRKPRRAVTRHWQLPTIADLMPQRSRRLTLMGIAMDMAACLVAVSGVALLLR